MRKLFFLFLLVFLFPQHGYASTELPLQAYAAILVEQETGQVLYSRNAHTRMYPASTTKMLTALIAYQHLQMDTVVTIGAEIRGMPAGFATGLHVEGETITVRTLLYALLVRSSNEAGRILALEVVRTIDDSTNVSYNDAKPRFSRLMNEYAAGLGATDTNFNNPYGLHHEAHYTTAHDLAIIARAFIAVPTLAAISATREFEGDSLGGVFHHSPNVRQYTWTNTNLMLPGAPFGHPYIVGGRTGFTTPAGHCFVGAAYHDGLGLISVVLYSQEPHRWQDTRVLLDYGFFNYGFRDIADDGQFMQTVSVYNPRLGDIDTLDILLYSGYNVLLHHAAYAGITHEIAFDPLYIIEETGYFRAPIEEGAAIGTAIFSTGGEVVFTAPVVAARAVYERTFDSDMDYYMALVMDNIFTRRALPYWFGFFGTVFGIAGICVAISTIRKARRYDKWS